MIRPQRYGQHSVAQFSQRPLHLVKIDQESSVDSVYSLRRQSRNVFQGQKRTLEPLGHFISHKPSKPLPNRFTLEASLEKECQQSQESSEQPMQVLNPPVLRIRRKQKLPKNLERDRLIEISNRWEQEARSLESKARRDNRFETKQESRDITSLLVGSLHAKLALLDQIDL